MLVKAVKNTFVFDFQEQHPQEIRLSSNGTKTYPIKDNQFILDSVELDELTNNKKAFINIKILLNDEWVDITTSNSLLYFENRTEVNGSKRLYSLYIGGDKKLRINNEGFITNKIILNNIILDEVKQTEDKLLLDLSIGTKYFIPNKVSLFFRNRKTKEEITLSSTAIHSHDKEPLPNSKNSSHKVKASFSIDIDKVHQLINSVYNPDEPFFNWLDLYYNFEIKEYTTSSYSFRLPTTLKTAYSNDLIFNSNNNTSYLLKTFGTDNSFFSLNYYIYETDNLQYFIEKSKEKQLSHPSTNKKPTIIIGEYHNTARDNGLAFFKYMIKHHRNNFNVYYAIKKGSRDLINLEKYQQYVKFIGSKEYSDIFLEANVIVESHSSFYICPFSTEFGLNAFKEKLCYFIQHGITLQKDVTHLYTYDNHHFLDYFITCSNRESELIHTKYLYPKEDILEFGFPRFDNLFSWKQKIKKLNYFSKNKHFFAFFTWRIGLNDLSKQEFIETEYYKNMMKLMNDSFWKNNPQFSLTIRLHPNLEKYIHTFTSQNSNVTISTENDSNSIQHYIINSDVMITDYSSAALDFAIMEKPVIYFLGLAENKNEDSTYQNYLPGDIITSYDELLTRLLNLSNEKKFTTEYLDKLDDIYTYRDNKACYRLAHHILEQTKKS